jgi:hypothetical protein
LASSPAVNNRANARSPTNNRIKDPHLSPNA